MNYCLVPWLRLLAPLWRFVALIGAMRLLWSCDKLSELSFQAAPARDAGFAGVASVTADDQGRFVLSWSDPPRSVANVKFKYEVYRALLDEAAPLWSGASYVLVKGSQGPVASTRAAVVEAQSDEAPLTRGELIATVRGATTYTVTDVLEDGKSYGYQVRVVVSEGMKDTNQRVLILRKDMPDYAGCISSRAVNSTSTEVTFDYPTGASQVLVMRGEALVFTSLGRSITTFTDVGLAPATTYTYRCVATLGGKNIVGAQDTTVTTLSRMNFAGLKSSGVSLSSDNRSITLHWSPATTPRGDVTYTVFGDANFSEVLAVTTEQTYTLTALTPGKLYSLGVRARDADGFERNTETVVVPVPDTRDRTPPAFDGLEEATPASNTKIALRWQPSPASDLFQYRIYATSNLNQPIAATTSTSYVVSGLVPSTSYSYIVRAVDTSGNEDRNTVQRGATTLSYAVPDFAGLTSVTPLPSIAGLTQLRLTWPVAGGSVTGYRVYMSSAWGGQNFSAPVAVLGANTSNATVGPYVAGQSTTSAVVSGLSSGTSYYFIVRAFYLDGSGNVFEESNTVERQGTTITMRPPAFSGVVSAAAGAGILGFSTVSVIWGEPGLDGIYDQFSIEYEPGLCTQAFSATPTSLSVLDPTARTAVVTGLTGETTYRFRVRTKYPTLSLGDVNTACREARTEPLPPTFGGVSSVSTPAGIAGFASLTVAWPEVQGSFSHYLIEWSTSSTFATVGGSLAPITQSTTTSANLTGLPSNTRVYVRVKAVFDGGGVTLSSGGTKILSGLTSPQAPLGEGLQSIATESGTSLRLTWTPPTNAAAVYSGYKVWRACGAGAAAQVLTSMGGVATQTFGNTTLSWIDTGLTSNVECCYQVRAFYDDGTYTLSSASTTLPQCGMPRVIAPTFAGVSTAVVPIASAGFGQIDLTWSPIASVESHNFSCYQVSVTTTPTGLAWPADCNTVDASLRSQATAGYSVSGLSPNTTYYVRARVVNMGGSSPVSNGDNQVLTVKTTPKQPTGDSLGTVEPAGVTSITLNYVPPSVLPQVSGLYNNVFLYLYQGSASAAATYKQSVIDPSGISSANFSATMTAGLATLPTAPTAGALVRLPLSEVTPGQSNVYRISGLTSGQPVCVMATAVHWVNGAAAQFLESAGSVWRCTTPTAEAPVFGGVSSVTTPVSTSGFSQLNIAWTPVGAGEEDKFSYYSVDWATSPTPASWNAQQITDRTVGSYVISGLSPNTTYFVRVRAVNARGSSPVSNGATTVLQGITTPKRPTGDQLSGFATPSQTSVSFTYTPPSSDTAVGGLYNSVFLWVRQGSQQNLQAYIHGIGTPVVANFTGVLSSAALSLTTAPTQGMLFQMPASALSGVNSQTFTLSGLTPNQPVCVQAFAVHWISGEPAQYLTSPSTAIQCGTPLAVAPVFAGVSSPLAGFNDTRDFNQMIVNWPAPVGVCTGIDISITTTPNSPDFDSSFLAYKNLPCSSTSMTVGGLTPHTTYYVRVRAKNVVGTDIYASGAGNEQSKSTVPPAISGDGVTTAVLAAQPKAPPTESIAWTLPSVSSYWNKIYIWRASAADLATATYAVKAAAAMNSDKSGPTSAPIFMVSAAADPSQTITTLSNTSTSLALGSPTCYLVRAVYVDANYYNASSNSLVSCSTVPFSPVEFTGVSTSGAALDGTWADGTAKIKLTFGALPAGDIDEYWVYISHKPDLASFDLTGSPWQVVDNRAVNSFNPSLNGLFIYVGGKHRTMSGEQYFVIRAKNYASPTPDTNIVISNALSVPAEQSNFVLVSSQSSKLGYDYWMMRYEASLDTGTWGSDTVTADEDSLANCNFQFHANKVARHSSCGTFNTTATVKSVASATPATATWHQAWTACRNSTVVGSIGTTGATTSDGGIYVRLPTEQEWRRASHWGVENYANMWTTYGGGASGCNTMSDALTVTGSKSLCKSRYSAVDMAGNLREWVDTRLTGYDISTYGEARFGYGPVIGKMLNNGIDHRTRRYHNIAPDSNNLALLLGSDYATIGVNYQKQVGAETETWQDPTVSVLPGTNAPTGFRCVAFINSKNLPTQDTLAQPNEPVFTSADIPGSPNPTASGALTWKIPENLYVGDTRPEHVRHGLGFHPNTTNLSVWPMNNATSGDAVDIVGGKTLTVVGGALGTAQGIDGKSYANVFNGSNYLKSSDPIFAQTGAFTMGGWFYSANWAGAGSQVLMSRYRSGGVGYRLWASGAFGCGFTAQSSYPPQPNPLAGGSGWHHIVIVRVSDSDNRVYVDGVAGTPSSCPPIGSDVDFNIGSQQNGGSIFTGRAANVFFHAGLAYSAEDVQRNYYAALVNGNSNSISTTISPYVTVNNYLKSQDQIRIEWLPWTKKYYSSTGWTSPSDGGMTYYLYRYIEPTLVDQRPTIPWAMQKNGLNVTTGPYGTLPTTITGSGATAMPLDPLYTNSAGAQVCDGSTAACKLVATISSSSCNSATPTGCGFSDGPGAGNGFSRESIYNYVLVVKDAAGNHVRPVVQRYRSPYFAGDFSKYATATFRTEPRIRRASIMLVDEAYQVNNTARLAIQPNPQVMSYVPMDISGLDHDFFIHKYETASYSGSISNNVTSNSTSSGSWPLQGTGTGSAVSDWRSNAGACYDNFWRRGMVDPVYCGDGLATNNATTTIVRSVDNVPPVTSIDQGAFWKACNNTAIQDGSNNLYYLNQVTDSEWLKAADWGDVAQQGTISQSAFFDNLSKTIATLENSTITVSGTATAGSNVITGIASTANVRVGQAATATGYITQGIVTAVTSDSVTLSTAATASGSASLALEALGTCHSAGGGALNSNSLATANCRSRYGVADHVGNVWEWTTSKMYNGTGYDNGVDGLWLGRGLPTTVVTTTPYDLLRGIPTLTISIGATVQANSDGYRYSTLLRASRRGGDYGESVAAGRWAMRMLGEPWSWSGNIGGRCAR